MLKSGYPNTMARYNRWQNRSLIAAASQLDDRARRSDRGAFFGSVHATLSHLLWGDTMWMSRFDAWERPPVSLGESGGWIGDWDDLVARREAADGAIIDWAARLTDADLSGALAWVSGAAGGRIERPLALCIMHFFNHQTHHRGQVHAMLTAAGLDPGPTDLFLMPHNA